jgi:hypothetical protein
MRGFTGNEKIIMDGSTVPLNGSAPRQCCAACYRRHAAY